MDVMRCLASRVLELRHLELDNSDSNISYKIDIVYHLSKNEEYLKKIEIAIEDEHYDYGSIIVKPGSSQGDIDVIFDPPINRAYSYAALNIIMMIMDEIVRLIEECEKTIPEPQPSNTV